jgi:hypothetical protein
MSVRSHAAEDVPAVLVGLGGSSVGVCVAVAVGGVLAVGVAVDVAVGVIVGALVDAPSMLAVEVAVRVAVAVGEGVLIEVLVRVVAAVKVVPAATADSGAVSQACADETLASSVQTKRIRSRCGFDRTIASDSWPGGRLRAPKRA